MAAERRKDVAWTIPSNIDGTVQYEGAQLAVLMDIRDELQKLNALLHCANFVAIPDILRTIRKHTEKPKPKKKRAPHLKVA